MNKETNNNQKQIPQGFKQTDIGLIPEDWEVLDFESTLAENDFSRDNLIPSSDFKTEGKYPIIDQGQAYIAGYTDQKNKVFEVKEPVILFGDHTRIFKYIDFPFVGGADGVKIFTPNNNLYDSRFYYYSLTNLKIPSRGYNRHYKLLKEQKIVKPPLPEQKKIAYVLSKIQQAIETQEKIIKTTQELKKALMQKLFTEGLNGEPQKQTEIGLIPESWEVVELGNLVTKPIKDGVHQTPTYTQSGIPFITAKDIINDEISFNNCKFISFEEHDRLYQKVNPEKNDILLTKVGTIGNVAIVRDDKPFSIFVQVALIKPNHSVINPLYLKYCLLSDKIQSEILRTSGRSTMKFIGVQKIAKLLIPIPSLSEQKKISSYLELFSDLIINKLIFVESLKQLFNSMLNQLMTGQIRVKDIEFELEETAKAVG